MARRPPRGRGNGPAHHDGYDDRPQASGGIPDGLLIGLLALFLAATLVAWTATGLAGLFAHGAWPDGVTFTRSPLALRELATAPQDLPAAWPETPAAQLSGYGLFWGLFIGELMVLLVLTVFTLGVASRGRAVRERRREEQAFTAYEPQLPTDKPAPTPPQEQPQPQAQAQAHPEAPPVAEETPSPPEPSEPSAALLPSPRTPSSSTPPPPPGAPPSSRRSTTPRAPRWSSHRTPRSGPRRRTPGPSSAPSSSTTRATSATPPPASTGRPPQAASCPTPPPYAQPPCSPRSARRPGSTRRWPTRRRHSSSAGCTRRRWTAARSARWPAGPRGPPPTNRYASSVPTPRPRPDSPGSWSPRSRPIRNGARWRRS